MEKKKKKQFLGFYWNIRKSEVLDPYSHMATTGWSWEATGPCECGSKRLCHQINSSLFFHQHRGWMLTVIHRAACFAISYPAHGAHSPYLPALSRDVHWQILCQSQTTLSSKESLAGCAILISLLNLSPGKWRWCHSNYSRGFGY